ncbi:MAG: hypothetical protein ACI3X7_03725 [Bacteroidaceae bacterium]
MKRTTLLHKVWLVLASAVMLLSAQNASAEYVRLTALSGTGGTGGEGYAKLVDGDKYTKMGHSFDPGNPERSEAWIIMKASKAVVPTNYFLVTGNDTGGNSGRNWKSWNIYAANFASDAEATVDAEWTLIDQRVDEPLPAANAQGVDFQFNKADGATEYLYYYIRIFESVQGTDVWLQMDEFGLGTANDFEAYLSSESSVDDAVTYSIMEGTRNNDEDEALKKLFDGDYSTKWGCAITDKPYFIIKASRSMSPTYYKLVTGTDNAAWNHRNWKDWKIYGIGNVDESLVTRDYEGWELIDNKVGVTEDVLPDINSYEVFMTPSEGNTKKYRYFKVEIAEIMSGTSGYMQMTEFALGDEYTLPMTLNSMYDKWVGKFDLDVFASQAVLDECAKALDSIKTTTDPVELSKLSARLTEQFNKYYSNVNAYKDFGAVMTNAKGLIADNILNAEATAYLEKYIGEESIAPCEDFPVGNYAYLKANRHLSTEGLNQETARLKVYVSMNYAVQIDPIYATYEPLSGSGGFSDAESHGALIDGDKTGTKWCSDSGNNGGPKPWFVVFKSSEPIKPTYYGLVTGGDTKNSPERNWKDWSVYAANFDSDEAATRDAEEWVLIDVRTNVGTDLLKAENIYENFINLNNPPTQEYQYFKIEIFNAGGNNEKQQMNEFTFYNEGNLNEQRDQFPIEVEEAMYEAGLESIDENTLCNRSLYEQYVEAYKSMEIAPDAAALISARNTLKELITKIATSNAKWQEYVEAVDMLSPEEFGDYEQVYAWATGYKEENEGPSATFQNGTYEYIITNRTISDEELEKESLRINAYMNALYEDSYIVLDGHTNSQWGDGHYKQIVDNSLETKWGGEASSNGDTYVIFRTLEAVNPFFYTLTTGGDTYTYQGRNWKRWSIYGANFEGDGLATKDSEDWVLVDEKVNVGQERLNPANLTASYFGFSSETTVPYTYYKVVVYEAYSGSQIQMQELRFGTEEEFDIIKEDYISKAEEFEYDVTCDQALIDAYEEKISEIGECINMEVLFRTNYEIEQLQQKILASKKVYEQYIAAVAGVEEYLDTNKLTESDALTDLLSYITAIEEPSEEGFPNGTAPYIIENHVLTDSVVLAEVDYLESLKAAAVRQGYVAGVDVSSLIVNRTFAKTESVDGGRKAEGWDGLLFKSGTNDDGVIYAAEFCETQDLFDISQTITDLKDGYYQIKLNAAFRQDKDTVTSTSYTYAPIAYANDVATFVQTVIEDMVTPDEAVDRVNCWFGSEHPDRPVVNPDDETDTLGYVVWGTMGSTYAFAAGRYEIPMVAKVTDGTLTFGLKSEGTINRNSWTVAGNFRLTYLGESEGQAADAIAEAVAYNSKRANTLCNSYVPELAYDISFSEAPNFAAATKEALAAISGQTTYNDLVTDGALFQNVLDCEKAYNELYIAKNKVYDKWIMHSMNHSNLEKDIYDVCDKLDAGAYETPEQALAAIGDLYKLYPDYLYVDMDKQTNVIATETADFEYELTGNGMRPNVTFKGFYENLTSDRVILAYEYKTEKDANDGVLYFGTPSINPNYQLAPAAMAATSDWKQAYVDITKAVETWNFGGSDNVIRWDLFGNNESYETICIRNVIVITADECNDDDLVDGVNAIETASDDAGQAIYSLSGQRVGKAGKGIFIINGKKYLVK